MRSGWGCIIAKMRYQPLFAPAEEQSWAEAFHLEGVVKFLTSLPSVLFSFTLY